MTLQHLQLLDQLPVSLGSQPSASSLSITFASDEPGFPVTFTSDMNYGTVGAGTLRTAAQIGNATGAAAFGTGARSAQVLRVTIATDDVVPVSQSGTWNITNISGTISLPTGAATETTLAAVDTKLGGTLTVQATNLDIRDLSSVSDSVSAVQSGTWTVDISTASTLSVENFPATVAVNAGAADASTLRVATSATNIAYQAKGKIAGTALTGSYATVLDPSSDLRAIWIFNSCNQTIMVSLDGGTTDTFELEPGESTSFDLAANGMKFSNAVNISAKHAGVVPTGGSVRVTGIS